MSTKENKNAAQVELFKLIQKDVSPRIPLASRIAKVLNISLDSAYRRIRGDFEISFEEGITLSKHFGISLDMLLFGIGKMQYTLIPSEFKGIENNLKFAQQLLDITDNIKGSQEGEIFITAADLPAFHFIAHKELTLFHVYSWYKNVYDYKGTYEDFIKEMYNDEIMNLLVQAHTNFQNTTSSEIWTENSIEPTLKLIRYHFETNHFSDTKSPVLICEQIVSILDTLEGWIKDGKKGVEKTPYRFYISEIDIGNTIIYFKNKSEPNCMIRLFTINGINIKDAGFCEDVELWIKSVIRHSTLISEISTKERIQFLTSQKQKILGVLNNL